MNFEYELPQCDYSKGIVDVKVDGKEYQIGIRSQLSPEFIKASGFFEQQKSVAKEKGISLIDIVTEEFDGIPIEKEVETETFNSMFARLISSLIYEWPFKEDVISELKENQDLCSFIFSKSKSMAVEFSKKKDS